MVANRDRSSLAHRALPWTAALIAIVSLAAPARAAFHLWSVDEIYSNASGTLQFIELVDTSGGQNFVNGQQISIANSSHSATNTFSLPGSSLSGSTFGHTLLLGTAGIHAAGAPTPDYIIPDGFLFTAGGTLSFFGQNGGTYAAMPTDGTLSRTWNDGTAVNSPKNFAGATGAIVVPEPVSAGLLTATASGLCLGMRRRARN